MDHHQDPQTAIARFQPENDDLIGLTRLSAEFFKLTGQRGYGYRKFYYLAADGTLPTVFERGRYYVRRADLPKIAAMCGVEIQHPPVAA